MLASETNIKNVICLIPEGGDSLDDISSLLDYLIGNKHYAVILDMKRIRSLYEIAMQVLGVACHTISKFGGDLMVSNAPNELIDEFIEIVDEELENAKTYCA